MRIFQRPSTYIEMYSVANLNEGVTQNIYMNWSETLETKEMSPQDKQKSVSITIDQIYLGTFILIVDKAPLFSIIFQRD